MKFSHVKIGQSFKWNQNRFVKCGASVAYCDKANSNGLPWLESFLDKIDIEVELVSKCENCKWFKIDYDQFPTLKGLPAEEFPYCELVDRIMDDDLEDPKTFSCSLFEERN